MATDIRSKRMLKERVALEKETAEYVCFFNDDDMFNFFCYLVGPEDSVYRHKLVKLQFEIPPRYPLVPPKVKFVQHRGHRIHPNLYVDGKLCLSILGTWPGEPWALSMTTDSVLRTVQSLLDSRPYLHEPHQRDSPAFNDFVRYSTWRCLLLDYLDNETHPAAKAWLQTYLVNNADTMMKELRQQQAVAIQHAQRVFTTPYKSTKITADYPALLQLLNDHIQASKDSNLAIASAPSTSLPAASDSEAAGQGGQTASGLKLADSGTSQGGLSACEVQLKRKLHAEGRTYASQGPDPLRSAQATEPSTARTLETPSRSEPPQKRTKQEPEVIDLT